MHDNLTGTRMLANFSYSFKSVATFFIVFRFNLIVIKKKKGYIAYCRSVHSF